MIVGVVVALLLLLAALWFLFSRRNSLVEKGFLPPDVWAFYQEAVLCVGLARASWVLDESKSVYKKRLTIGTGTEYEYLMKIWKAFGDDLGIQEAFAICNPSLIVAFQSQAKIQKQRMQDSSTFGRKDWQKGPDAEFKQWILTVGLTPLIESFPELQRDEVPIIPCAHGTDTSIANKICQTGFAALSSLDDGYYGKGIYFTTSTFYIIPYIANRRSPCVIISYILPGNVFPVTEHHLGPNNLLGKPLKGAHQSHLACTSVDGSVIPKPRPADPSDPYFFEWVVGQESQIVPAYLVNIKMKSLMELTGNYTKLKKDNFKSSPSSSSLPTVERTKVTLTRV